MSDDEVKALLIVVFLATGALGFWTAWVCHSARKYGLPGSDAAIWALLATVFVLFSLTRFARGAGLLKGWGEWLRIIARENGMYADRRNFQIAASIAVLLLVVALFVYGFFFLWDYIKRYRLAIGFASLAVGFAMIRFISLHEVDAWNAAAPWIRTVVELIAAIGASVVAVMRLSQLRSVVRVKKQLAARYPADTPVRSAAGVRRSR